MAPFAVALGLLAWMLAFGHTRYGPGHPAVFAASAVLIAVGLAVGLAGLFAARALPLPLRLVIGLLYLPTALASALVAGF